MRPIRAVLYGVGAMNSMVCELLLERDVQIVGAVGRSAAGRDLGDVCGLGANLGIVVQADPDVVLGQCHADIAILATNNLLRDNSAHIEACVRHGVNVLTIAGEAMYPWYTAPSEAARLDALARHHGVTITGGGHTDTLWVGLPVALTGASRTIEAIRCTATYAISGENLSDETCAEIGVGMTPEQFADRFPAEPDPGEGPPVGRNKLEAMAACLELTVSGVKMSTRAAVCEEEFKIVYADGAVRGIEVGQVEGLVQGCEITTLEGPVLSLDCIVRPQGDSAERWVIEGEPQLIMETRAIGRDSLATCTQAVARIPDVIDAAPGYRCRDEYPPLRWSRPGRRLQPRTPLT